MPLALRPAKNCSGRAMPQKATTGAGDLRNFHTAAQTPDGAAPTPSAKFGFEGGIIGRNCQDVRAHRCMQSFPEISGGEQGVVPVRAIDDQDVDVAKELPVLEAVVEDVNLGSNLIRCSFSESSGMVTLGSNVDRHSGFASNQQRLIAVLLGCAFWN